MENIQIKDFHEPKFDVPEGKYTSTQILSISSSYSADVELYYSLDGSFPNKKYWGPIAIRKSAVIKVIIVDDKTRSEVFTKQYVVEKEYCAEKGKIVVIGGAEHCKELHEKIVSLVGGPQNAKIAFVPASSGVPYSSGMDRVTRFRDITGVEIDETKVPELDGKKDYSGIDNNSNFWILPIALKDDETTGEGVENDPDYPLVDESTFPAIDESQWFKNGANKQIAEKLLHGGYNILFFPGGNQHRFIECLLYPDKTETPVLSVIKEIYEERGGVLAGTSAGGAVFSNRMIMGGGSYSSMLNGIVQTEGEYIFYDEDYSPHVNRSDNRVWIGKGLGFLDKNIITDTHFLARGRIGRLIAASLRLKKETGRKMIGLGVGEDTGVIVHDDYTCEVSGATGVIVVDLSNVDVEDMSEKNYSLDNIIIHSLQNKDVFKIFPDGHTKVLSINEKKKEISADSLRSTDKVFEGDIFGKNKLKNSIKNLVMGDIADTIGIELNDNLADSYDYLESGNIEDNGSVLFLLRKNIFTKGYQGEIEYNWYGQGDRYYPRLIDEKVYDAISAENVILDVYSLKLINFPDLSDGRDMPLLSEYLADGYSRSDWQRLFDDRKKFRLGVLIMPFDKHKYISFRTFYLDYAYNDYARNGYYSPPRLANGTDVSDYKDYDIIQLADAPGVEIFIENESIGKTNKYGILNKACPLHGDEETQIKAVLDGKYKYEIEVKSIVCPLSRAVVKFTDESYSL